MVRNASGRSEPEGSDTEGSASDPGPNAFGSQFRAARADFERHVQATRAQLDATTERIEARTGRNLILAIVIGVVFGAIFLASLIFFKVAFVAFAIALACFATFELVGALRAGGRRVPRVPATVGAGVLMPLTYFWGAAGLWWGVVATIAILVGWRATYQLAASRRTASIDLTRDAMAAVFVTAYVGLLAGFAVLLTAQPGGEWWTLAFIVTVVVIDTSAYASGLMWGKHPMAPRISPKKTWEGFAGAFVGSVIAGVLLSTFMLGQPWWFGIIFGAALLVSATAGDLAESLIKRDLGIKDMSSWLPGHGGLLDRLDSILPSALVAYALLRIVSG